MKKIIIILFILLFLPFKSLALENSTVNIAFTIDNNYPIYTLLAINSMLINNTSNADIHFYIVENNLTTANMNKMRKFIEKKGQKVDFINIDTNVIDKGINYFTFSNRITPIAMARIMLPSLLPDDVEKVLYLDGDILVTGNIIELYNYDLKGYPLGMAGNNYQPKHFLPCTAKCRKKHFYGNSGVILMDLKKWRQENISDKLLKYLHANKKYFYFIKPKGDNWDQKFFLYPDQDLINVVLDGRIKQLPQRWNNQVVNYELILPIRNKGILHYIGVVKPWSFPEYFDPANSLYMQYWEKSEFKWYKYYYAYMSFVKHYKHLAKIKFLRIRQNLKKYNPFVYQEVYLNYEVER